MIRLAHYENKVNFDFFDVFAVFHTLCAFKKTDYPYRLTTFCFFAEYYLFYEASKIKLNSCIKSLVWSSFYLLNKIKNLY